MKITDIRIQDTFGVKDFRLQLGTAAVLQGHNGSGKSSVLNALGTVFGGGTDPSVVRSWPCSCTASREGDALLPQADCAKCGGSGRLRAEKSVVWFRLSDGTEVEKITRRKRGKPGIIDADWTTDLEVRQPDGTPRGAPKEYIDSLAGSMIDPSEILSIDTTKAPGRALLSKRMLELMPNMRFEPAEIAAAAKYAAPDGSETLAIPADSRPVTLSGLKKLRDTVEEQRRREGRRAEEAGGAVTSLRESLPPAPADVAKLLTEAEKYLAAVEQAEREACGEVAEQGYRGQQEAKDVHTESVRAIDAEIAARKQELDEERQRRIAEVDNARATVLEEVAAKWRNGINQVAEEAAPEKQKAQEVLARLRSQQDDVLRSEGVLREIARNEQVNDAACHTYQQLTKVLERLDRLRTDRLRQLPVAGLEIYPDRVVLDGIEWQNVNLAKRVEVALQIVAAASGELQFLLLDNFEHCDADTRGALMAGLKDAGFQVLAAIVSEEDRLTVQVVEE